MTALARIIKQRIARTGPISIADYMTECLLHPRYGYYVTRDPFGTRGDFVTAPEISQMFGELIGLTLAQAWQDQGKPDQFPLAEAGPGRGTLMADILRATRNIPGFHTAAQVHLIEASPTLRALQAKAVQGAQFHDTPQTLPDQPLYFVANEFFDALPIRQFIRQGDAWAERVVGLQSDALAFGLTPPVALAALTERLDDTQDGDLIETCAAIAPFLDPITTRIASHGGAALIIDYGDWRAKGDTFQAVKTHQKVDPLAMPGEADLTAHVDFGAIAAAAGPLSHTELTTQGLFLERLGIAARAQNLAKQLKGDALTQHLDAHDRLTNPARMGDLFKCIGMTPHGAPALAGLTI